MQYNAFMRKIELLFLIIITILLGSLYTLILQNEQNIKLAKDYVVSVFKKDINKKPEQNSAQNSYWAPYMKNLEKTIKTNWNPPKSEASKRVVVVFKINKQGELLALKILQSSNDEEADKAALKAVRITSPFKPLPEQFEGRNIDIEFTFDYNVLSKK